MANHEQRTKTALSSMLPFIPGNPIQAKNMEAAKARAQKDGTCVMLGSEHGIYIGSPVEAKGSKSEGR